MLHETNEEIDEQAEFANCLKEQKNDYGTVSRKNLTRKQSYQKAESESGLNTKFFVCLLLFIFFVANLTYIIIQSVNVEGSMEELQQIEQIGHLISSGSKLQNYQPQDFYWFSVSTRDLILNSNLDNLYKRSRQPYNMTRELHLRAILFTQLIHNVDFYGNVKVQLSPFETDMQKKESVIKLVMDLEKNYYEQKYQISKYENLQLRFCIVVPSYNNVNSKLYLRNLDSLFMQDYHNYHIVYIDDHSPDETGEFVKKYVKDKQIPQDKIKIIINNMNKKAMQNIYEKIHQECPDGEIVGLIDGDDSFNGRQVLKLYNALFHQKKAALIYSNFLKVIQNKRTQYGFGNDALRIYFEPGPSQGRIPILATHFVTFYSEVFKKINKQDFCYSNGTFLDYAYDKAILTPLMEMAYERSYYLPEMVYEYRNDTGMNDAGDKWQRVADLIDQKPKYEALKDWNFIDEHEIIAMKTKQKNTTTN